MFVLDTNTVSYYLKGAGRVADRLLATPRRAVALPAVVVYELEYGVRSLGRRRREQVREFLGAFEVLPLGRDEAAEAARVREELERGGTPIGPLDTLIAGTARCRGGVLVTHNTREFSRVKGLRIEDWY